MSTPQLEPASESVQSLVSQVTEEFTSRYSRSPDFIVAAPGRVNLIGEHVDYNDGFVMPMAIDRCVVIAASLKTTPADSQAALYSVNLKESATIPVAGELLPHTQGWSKYVEGVVAGFLERDVRIPAFDAVLQSDVPLGGGLSSSAALEVATATLLEAITGHRLDAAEKALLCQRAEHRFAGVPCGIMDQFSSVFAKAGELMLLDCRSQHIEPVPFDAPELSVLITNSNVQHELAGGEYARRRAQCDSALAVLNQASWRSVTSEQLTAAKDRLSDEQFRRARHVVTEIQRTTEAARALRAGDWAGVGQCMYASHQSLSDDFEVSCSELDLLVRLAREAGEAGGVIGSRMTGGGFGGCTVTLVKTAAVEQLSSRIAREYQTTTGIVPHSFATRPARGAHVILQN